MKIFIALMNFGYGAVAAGMDDAKLNSYKRNLYFRTVDKKDDISDKLSQLQEKLIKAKEYSTNPSAIDVMNAEIIRFDNCLFEFMQDLYSDLEVEQEVPSCHKTDPLNESDSDN